MLFFAILEKQKFLYYKREIYNKNNSAYNEIL